MFLGLPASRAATLPALHLDLADFFSFRPQHPQSQSGAWGHTLGQGKGTLSIPFSPFTAPPEASATNLNIRPHLSIFGCSRPPSSPTAWGNPSSHLPQAGLIPSGWCTTWVPTIFPFNICQPSRLRAYSSSIYGPNLQPTHLLHHPDIPTLVPGGAMCTTGMAV